MIEEPKGAVTLPESQAQHIEIAPNVGAGLSLIRRNFVFIFFVAVVVTAAAAWLLLGQKHRYSAAGTIFVMSSTKSTIADLAGLNPSRPENYVKALLMSNRLRLRVAEDLHLSSSEAFWSPVVVPKDRNRDTLLQQLNRLVQVDEKQGLITITGSTISPELSRDLTNALIDRLSQNLEHVNTQKKDLIELQVAQSKKELRDAEDKLSVYQDKDRLSAVEDEMGSVELQSMLVLDNSLATAEASLRAVDEELNAPGDLDTKLLMQTRQAGLKGQVEVFRKVVRARQAKLASIPEAVLSFTRLHRDVQTKEKIYALLTEQYHLARSRETEKEIPYQIVDKAILPIVPMPLHRGLKLGGAFFVGVILGMWLSMLREALRSGRPS